LNQDADPGRSGDAAKRKASTSQSAAPGLRTLLLVFAGYFLLQAISRGLISETLGMDDAQESLLAQKWSWGYGPQPPLYTWLVIIFSNIFGLSSFTMALLKNALLFGIYILTYFIARRITRSHLVAVSAAVALQFMPSIAYEAHRELTHSILASFMVLATLLAFLRLQESDKEGAPPRQGGVLPSSVPSLSASGHYLLLGVLGGLGMISKYNYSIFYVALFLAALSLKSWRPTVLSIRAAGALALTLLILAPNLLWIRNHPDLAFSSAGKFDIDPTHSIKSMVHGVGSWASTCLDQAGILVLIFVLLSWREFFARRSKSKVQPVPADLNIHTNGIRLFLRMFLFSSLIIVLGIIISGATNCRNRWLQPLVIPMPILVVMMFQKHLNSRRFKIISLLATIVAVGVTIGAPGRVLLTERLGKVEGLNMPYKGLARQIAKPLANASMIYCADTAMAGNLRVWFPDKAITAPGLAKLYPPEPRCALVWDASVSRASAFVSQASVLTGNRPEEAVYFEERLKYHRVKTMRLGVLTAPAR